MKRVNSILLIAAVLASGGYHTAIAASTDGIQVGAGFQYETSRTTSVTISLALPDGNPALLSFYSEGANGLRLLENAVTDAQGYYGGQLQLPAHLSQVVLVVRGAERQDSFTLPISAASITYAE